MCHTFSSLLFLFLFASLGFTSKRGLENGTDDENPLKRIKTDVSEEDYPDFSDDNESLESTFHAALEDLEEAMTVMRREELDIFKALRHDDVETVSVALELGFDCMESFDVPEMEDFVTPLMIASYYGSVSVVQCLLKQGAVTSTISPHYRRTALDFALISCNAKIVVLLAPPEQAVMSEASSELALKLNGLKFSTDEKTQLVKVFLDHVSWDLAGTDTLGRNVLSFALAHVCSPDLVQFLVEAGCPASEGIIHQLIAWYSVFEFFAMPYSLSKIRRNVVCPMLRRFSSQIDQLDQTGRTPLHRSVQQGLTEVTMLLIRRGARGEIPAVLGLSAADIAMAKCTTNGTKVKRLLAYNRLIFQFLELKKGLEDPNSLLCLLAKEIIWTFIMPMMIELFALCQHSPATKIQFVCLMTCALAKDPNQPLPLLPVKLLAIIFDRAFIPAVPVRGHPPRRKVL